MQIADSFTPPLRSTIVTPIFQGEQLVGVFTGYSPKVNGFGDAHMYSFERAVSLLTEAVAVSTFRPTVVSFPLKRTYPS
jgi:putative methionine-R-sulfoxide reductase with GAF domain